MMNWSGYLYLNRNTLMLQSVEKAVVLSDRRSESVCGIDVIEVNDSTHGENG